MGSPCILFYFKASPPPSSFCLLQFIFHFDEPCGSSEYWNRVVIQNSAGSVYPEGVDLERLDPLHSTPLRFTLRSTRTRIVQCKWNNEKQSLPQITRPLTRNKNKGSGLTQSTQLLYWVYCSLYRYSARRRDRTNLRSACWWAYIISLPSDSTFFPLFLLNT